MREPKHYQDRSGRHTIAWYENGKFMRKTFVDALPAEILYQEKILGHPIDKDALILKEVTTLRKYVTGGRMGELEAENARLSSELESMRQVKLAQRQNPRKWTNTIAVEWALDQELNTGTKAVLVSFAAHCNEEFESWVSVKRIAQKWKMDRDTVRSAIRDLNDKKLLTDTGKRTGTTNQVKVYRLPDALERGGDCHPFHDQSGTEAPDKGGTRGGESAPNKEQGNKEADVVDGVSNPQRAAATATATDPLDFCIRNAKRWPGLNLIQEWNEYVDHRHKIKRPATIENFTDAWLSRAQCRYGKIVRKPKPKRPLVEAEKVGGTWMPNAGEPLSKSEAVREPAWWTEFIKTCHPGSRVGFEELSKRDYFAEMFKEGERWASDRNRAGAI